MEKEELTKFEKFEIAIKKGVTCDIEKGIVYGVRGKEIEKNKTQKYIKVNFRYNKKIYSLFAHQFIYFCKYGEYDISLNINHKNEIKDDNRIDNLELMTHRENIVYSLENTIGFVGIDKKGKKFRAKIGITINNICKNIHIGNFETPEIAFAHRELAIEHERGLESHSKQHIKEFREFIKELYSNLPEIKKPSL